LTKLINNFGDFGIHVMDMNGNEINNMHSKYIKKHYFSIKEEEKKQRHLRAKNAFLKNFLTEEEQIVKDIVD